MNVKKILSFCNSHLKTLNPHMIITEENMVIVPKEFKVQNLYGVSIISGKNKKDRLKIPSPVSNTTNPS